MTSPPAHDQAVLIIPTAGDPPEDLVRTWVCATLGRVPVVPRLVAGIVVDELVANAREHGSLPCVLRLSLDGSRRHLLVFVEDSAVDDGEMWPLRTGLTLVDCLTTDWAVHPRPRGKTVWAEIALGVAAPCLVTPPRPPPGAWPR